MSLEFENISKRSGDLPQINMAFYSFGPGRILSLALPVRHSWNRQQKWKYDTLFILRGFFQGGEGELWEKLSSRSRGDSVGLGYLNDLGTGVHFFCTWLFLLIYYQAFPNHLTVIRSRRTPGVQVRNKQNEMKWNTKSCPKCLQFAQCGGANPELALTGGLLLSLLIKLSMF